MRLLSSWSWLVLPVVGIPLVVKEFCASFSGAFSRPEQRENFETVVTGLAVSENRTIAGIHQQFLNGPTYESLHNFMSNSPWSVERLSELRLEYVRRKFTKTIAAESQPRIQVLSEARHTIENSSKNFTFEVALASESAQNVDRQNLQQAEYLKELQPNKFGFRAVVAIDATFAHHTGKNIYGVYWYWDYAQRRYALAQRLVLSTLITLQKQIPLGWRLYHRGFLEEQKIYLEATQPAAEADEAAWEEYNELVEKFEQNKKEHKKQQELAGELVDECEQLKLPVDAYVCDAAMALPELMDRIEEYGKAWVSRLAKNRLVQTAKGGFETVESFARSLPKTAFALVNVETRHGQKRTYWCFSVVVMVHGWKRLRIVISYDNEELEGEPIYLLTNKKQWVQPQKIVQLYMMRDPVEHLIRDGKQEVGLEDCQQRNEDGVRKHWELSFVAHTFLELGFEVPILPGVPAVRLETIGQKSRVMKGALLQGFVNFVKQWVLEGRDTKELVWQIMSKRLNRLAA